MDGKRERSEPHTGAKRYVRRDEEGGASKRAMT